MVYNCLKGLRQGTSVLRYRALGFVVGMVGLLSCGLAVRADSSCENPEFFSRCAATCFPSCRQIEFRSRFMSACSAARRNPVNLPGAACELRAESSGPAAEVPRSGQPQPPLQSALPPSATSACIQQARKSMSLEQKLQLVRNPDTRQKLQERYKEFPKCAPEPAALFELIKCIEVGSQELRNFFDPLEKRVRWAPGQSDKDFCGRVVPMFQDDTNDQLQETERRASGLSSEFQKVVECAGSMREWLGKRDPNPARRDDKSENRPDGPDKQTQGALTAMSTEMREQLEKVGKAEGNVKKVLEDLDRSQRQVTADLDRAIFQCPVPQR
jgi:hypothetical protein